MTALTAKRRRILLTGGTSGIGLELIRRWGNRHDIVTTGRSLSDELETLLENRPGISHALADQAKPMEAADRIWQAIETRGWETLDHAVLNNAGACENIVKTAVIIMSLFNLYPPVRRTLGNETDPR